MGRASRANQRTRAAESACALREIFILIKRHFGYSFKNPQKREQKGSPWSLFLFHFESLSHLFQIEMPILMRKRTHALGATGPL